MDCAVNGERHPVDEPVKVGELQVWDVVSSTAVKSVGFFPRSRYATPVSSMKATLHGLAVFAATLAAGVDAFAQDTEIPVGNWQSPERTTYTNPAFTGAELYLNIDVAEDGTFRGSWGRYQCTGFPGALGISIYSCARIGSARVSGRIGPGSEGVIDLEDLGRSAFDWTAPAADELAIDLPRNWQGSSSAILYRARLTRDGREKQEDTSSAARDERPLLSANALYREFDADADAALERYGGKTLVLEGRRGALIPLGDGGAAVHIPDGFLPRALVLLFPDLRQLDGIGEGAQFRFRCAVTDFDYQYVSMENCVIVRE